MEQPSEIDAIGMDEQQNMQPKNVNFDVKGKIEFRNVWFRYPTRKTDWVLKGLNLTIEANETVALVGESGCGKSTFVSLLMRYYDVDSGEILLDGVNIQVYNLHQLRNAMGMVMQEPILFNYSIYENILYGKPDAKNSEILKAAEIANAMEFIKQISDDQMSIDLKDPKVLLK
jgi:ATP-binding cassette subfamily B (MDR/TAP) protein 1